MIGKKLRRDVDFSEFLKVLRRQGKPAYLPFYEHVTVQSFIARRTGLQFGPQTPLRDWMEIYMNFWLDMGYDCIPLEVGPYLKMAEGHGAVTEGSEAHALIHNMEEFNKYPWPDEERPMNFEPFEILQEIMPPGIKMVAGVCGWLYEWVSQLMGVMGLSYALLDAPDLVAKMFERIGRIHLAGNRRLARMERVGALRQGDDLGFKTSTFLCPADLRRYVFPIYRQMTDNAHAAGKPFILHSCGNLAEVYDDLIDDCQIDAKHSFEDVILPVNEFKKQYGQRITPIGGLDVDTICRGTEAELRRYAREKIEQCFAGDGYWALGTGNSLTDYMPVENYLIVLEEGMNARL